MHPKLCVNAISSFNWNFEQDLALWKTLGVTSAGLLSNKIRDDVGGSIGRLISEGIRPRVIVCEGFNLGSPPTWNEKLDELGELVESAAAADSECVVYFPPGRTTGDPWEQVLDLFCEAVMPAVSHANDCGVRLGIEPSRRVDASFVNSLLDGITVARRTGLGVVLDFGNSWMESNLRETIIGAARHISLVQITDVDIGGWGKPAGRGRVHIGEGDLQLDRMMRDVVDSGYRGVYDLEVLGHAAAREDYGVALRRGIVSASRLLARAGVA